MTMTLNRLTEIKKKNEELVMVRKLIASKAEEMAKHTAYRKQILVCPEVTKLLRRLKMRSKRKA